MAITKIKALTKQIDCPFCFSLLEWDDKSDIKVMNGNEYVICPQCNRNILLDPKKEYWAEENDSDEEKSANADYSISKDYETLFEKNFTISEQDKHGNFYSSEHIYTNKSDPIFSLLEM